MELCNEVKLSGQIVKEYELKYTIDNLPVLRFVLEHQSRQIENGLPCNTKCKMFCLMLLKKNTKTNNLINENVTVSGFLNQNSKSQIVLHIKEITFLNKGKHNVITSNS